MKLTQEQINIINTAIFDNCEHVQVSKDAAGFINLSFDWYFANYPKHFVEGRGLNWDFCKKRKSPFDIAKKKVAYWAGYCRAKFGNDCGFIKY